LIVPADARASPAISTAKRSLAHCSASEKSGETQISRFRDGWLQPKDGLVRLPQAESI
jgi:hypothetical protein